MINSYIRSCGSLVNNFCDNIYSFIFSEIAYFSECKNEQYVAEKYYLMAIENGNSHSLYELGEFYLKNGDYEKMKKYLNLSVKNGNLKAALKLGNYYCRVEIKYDLMEKYYLIGIKGGCFYSMNNLANYYYRAKRNYSEMKKYCETIIKNKKRCCDKICASAMLGLGNYYQHVERNYKQMKKYYNMSIKKGNIVAMEKMCMYYLTVRYNFYKMKNYLLMILKYNYSNKNILIDMVYAEIKKKLCGDKILDKYLKYQIKILNINIEKYL